LKKKKLEIILAAEKRFIKHGLNKTTLDEVARDMRIGKATIYHYFKSKEELFAGTIEQQISVYIEQVKAIFSSESDDLTNKLAAFIKLKLNLKEQFPLIYLLIVTFITSIPKAYENKLINELFKKEEEILKSSLDTSQKKDEKTHINLYGFISLDSFSLIITGEIFNKVVEQDENSSNNFISFNTQKYLHILNAQGKK
jgi:AcrR family transcriptional regulator